LARLSLFRACLLEALVIEFNWVVSLLESFLELFDFSFKPFLLLLMLCFESKNLVVGFTGNSVTVDALSGHGVNVVLQISNLIFHFADGVLGKPKKVNN